MIIKIKLSTGKEIEVTQDELKELFGSGIAPIYIQPYIPCPVPPYTPWSYHPTITCEGNT